MTDNAKKPPNLRQLARNMQLRAQSSRALTSGYLGSDDKRPQAWEDYGYPADVGFDRLYNMFDRNGLARAGVMIPVKYCWQAVPKVYAGEVRDGDERNPWEREFDRIADRLRLWAKLKAADKRQRVGEYGAFVVQIKGTAEEADFTRELGRISADQIVSFIPVYQAQLEPVTWDTDRRSERYGMPETYQFNESAIDGQAQDRPRNTTVHHSRVIIFAEDADDDTIYGIPTNRAGFNHLLNIEKIEGAGGEGFWKNAAQKLIFSDKPGEDYSEMDEDEEKQWDEIVQAFQANWGKYMTASGMDVTNLQSTLIDPKSFFEISLGLYAASVEIPAKVLVGTQTGVLAGDADYAQLLQTCQSRRENWLTEMVSKTIDWLIKHGAVRPVDYSMEWDDIQAPSDDAKLDLVNKMVDANQKAIFAMGVPIFTLGEIRDIGGWKVAPVAGAPDLDEDEGEDEDGENGSGA